MLAARLDPIESVELTGWLEADVQTAFPVLLIDDVPALLCEWRADPNAPAAPRGAFRFRSSSIKQGAVVKLCLQEGKRRFVLIERIAQHAIHPANLLRQTAALAEVARHMDSLAIVCWEGTHNPLGRAKVLFDVASRKYPAIVVAYSFPEFGGKLWAPLRHVDFPCVLIPWDERARYHRAIDAQGISFSKIWICKPRLPAFVLAQKLGHRASVILDIDDNEAHFARSPGSDRKFYGSSSVGLADFISAGIKARTVASASLQDRFGGEIVRHARAPRPLSGVQGSSEVRRVGFIGTVRPHKNLLKAAHAIRAFGVLNDLKIEFSVEGEFYPESLKAQLLAAGAVLSGPAPSDQLAEALEKYDVILAGYPAEERDSDAIVRYQISAKIGDALAAGRPVLVPLSPATVDLRNTSGVFLFDQLSFATNLQAALQHSSPIGLPHDFTLEGAGEAFMRACVIADQSTKGGSVFSCLPDPTSPHTHARVRKVVLLWKQQDGGLYGRRVDQIARSYKRLTPEATILVLQLCDDRAFHYHMKAAASDRLSESALILQSLNESYPKAGPAPGGVDIHTLRFSGHSDVRASFMAFLSLHDIYPSNSVFILFPIVPYLEELTDLIYTYPYIVDVVDNEVMWPSAPYERRRVLAQYRELCRTATTVCFNSLENREFFRREGWLNGTSINLIENWYRRPDRMPNGTGQPAASGFHMIYSGNLNDRIDFAALSGLVRSIPSSWLHIYGTAERADREFQLLMMQERVVYHGAQKEATVLDALQWMDVGLVPHLATHISAFMNPLKVYMYRAAGLPCVAARVAGIEAADGVTFCRDGTEFIDAVAMHARRKERGVARAASCTKIVGEEQERRYIELINSKFSPFHGGSGRMR